MWHVLCIMLHILLAKSKVVKRKLRSGLKNPLSTPSVQFSCPVMSNFLGPHGLPTPGFPVYHHLPEPTQTHVHRIGDAIQPSHPLLSPSLPAFNLMYNSRILAKQQLRISIYAIIFHQTTFPNIVYLLLWW